MSASETMLVVNADDFGCSPGVSRGILRAHREGVVTSTSVLGNCDDLRGVCALLGEAPNLGVGVHLALVGGRPVSASASLPSLTNPDGGFPTRAQDFFKSWIMGHIDVSEIEGEFDAQISRLRDAGVHPDHIDTHRHLGFVPAVGRAMATVARKHGIAGIRSAVERPSLAWLTDPTRGLEAGLLTGLAWLTRRQMGALRHGPQSWGFVEVGRLDEVRILEILGRMGPGAHELICHPGEEDDTEFEPGEAPHLRAHELVALTSHKVRRAFERRGVKLCRWKDLF
ncbi:MAG TPA: ChbG/HpnK family deacetylase [Polyangia bacterium]|nr:ChbG/HpnK family deacetylase [Polyangia bacterium]